MPTPQEFWDTLTHCVGWHGGCDGDMEGVSHIASCPLYGRQEMTMDDGDFGVGLLFWAMIALFVIGDLIWALILAYGLIK